jgi:hypothetical protein
VVLLRVRAVLGEVLYINRLGLLPADVQGNGHHIHALLLQALQHVLSKVEGRLRGGHCPSLLGENGLVPVPILLLHVPVDVRRERHLADIADFLVQRLVHVVE